MSVIAIQAEAAPHRITAPPKELATSFATIRTHAHEALTELRIVPGVLRAEGTAPDLAPPPTLRDLPDLATAARNAGLTVTVAVTGTPEALPPGVEVSAFRIVQEALNNAMRHAPASAVRLDLTYGPNELRLRVHNGPGAAGTVTPASGNGHGIRGIQERVGMLAGHLTVGATSDGGYLVDAVLPHTKALEP